MSLNEVFGNWKKWGDADEKGALNYITPEVVKQSLKSVEFGKIYSLAYPIVDNSPRYPVWPNRSRPVHVPRLSYRDEESGSGDDVIVLNTHNQTHLDALGHVWSDGKIYNGYNQSDNVSSKGLKMCGIDKVGGIVTRGILLDIPKLKKTEYLKKGEAIDSNDLEMAAEMEGVKLRSGDSLLVYTGHSRTWDSHNPLDYFRGNPGLSEDTVDLIDRYQISLIGSDNYSVEVEPLPDGKYDIPLHKELLWKRGIYLLELMNLDDIVKDCVYKFLFVVAPLPINGGFGSPVNPLAIR